MVIDGTPYGVSCAIDLQHYLITMPWVTWRCTATTPLVRTLLPTFLAPLTHCFIRHHNPTCGTPFIYITVAQRKTEIQLDSVAQDLGGKTMTLRGWDR